MNWTETGRLWVLNAVQINQWWNTVEHSGTKTVMVWLFKAGCHGTTSLMQKLIHTTIRKRKTNLSLSPSPFHFVWCRQMSQQCGHAECLVTEMLKSKKQMHFGLNCYSIQWKWFRASTKSSHGFGDTSFCFRDLPPPSATRFCAVLLPQFASFFVGLQLSISRVNLCQTC